MTVGYVLDRWIELSQTFVVEEVKELSRESVEVAVLALHRGSSGELDQVPATFMRDTPSGSQHLWAHARWAARRPRRYLAFLAAVRRHPQERREMAWKRLPWAADRLSAQGVDRLHAHFAWAGAAAAEALAALTGWPWALTVHARDIYAPRPGLSSKLERCTRLVTVCQYNVDFLRTRHAVRRDIDLVVCGVTVPDPWVRPPVDVDVVAVGRLVEKKGFDVLLHAMAQLRETGPSYRLVIVGDGPERTRLEALVSELGLSATVTFAGSVPHADVLDLIGRSAVLCLPARVARDGDADSMPLVVKEAMAREVAVVVTPVGGLPELVDDAVGRVVPTEDAAALAEALGALLGDDDLRCDLGMKGRARIVSRFTLQTEVAKLRGVLAGMR